MESVFNFRVLTRQKWSCGISCFITFC